MTDAQRELVLCSAGAQAVVAGAGSGKSTSLISRLLVMRKHLGIPLTSISVFTFTRNSRFDFIDKLVRSAEQWGVPFDEAEATRRVRTFHSKALELCGSVLPSGLQIFELMGKEARPAPSTDDERAFLDKQAELADQVDNPYDSGSSTEQVKVLMAVYEQCHADDAPFRDAVRALLLYATKTGPRDPKAAGTDWDRREWAVKRDQALTEHAADFWTERQLWPKPYVSAPPKTLRVEQLEFAANGYVPELDAFIVLGADRTLKQKIKVKGSSFSPFYSGRSKHHVLLRGCADTVFFANTPEDFDYLDELVAAAQQLARGEAPKFRFVAPGDYAKTDVAQALYGMGVFAENLALKPRDISAALQRNSRLTRLEHHFLYAVSRFFAQFQVYNEAHGIRTFNDLFFMLSGDSAALQSVPLSKLRSMQHLLIDEFQDISPLVVHFVRGLHQELARRSNGQDRPTLMVVGDDWQSIYGWRGSAPRFFLRFANFFDGAQPKPLLLTANFRSSQHVIDCAQSVLLKTDPQHRMDKTCRAENRAVAGLGTPVLVLEQDRAERDVAAIVERLLRLCEAEDDILVLSRSVLAGEQAEAACRHLKAGDRIRFMTVHKSKGLEADYAVILDDMAYDLRNPMRNALYDLAGFEQGYDASQADEAKRLAYVAITRAKKVCIWVGSPREGAAMSALPANAPYCRRVDVGQLMTILENLSSPATH